MTTRAVKTGGLCWIDGQWHLAAKPIEAGAIVELKTTYGKWVRVRVKFRDLDRETMLAICRSEGDEWQRLAPINHEYDRLRWPQSASGGRHSS
ncbi:MAG TPA: hypothetical protein VG433_10095 [Pirellulales bacterium]|jgi:hypothetical protein|nr:hypothetical protein [Pirellulales bacterium]